MFSRLVYLFQFVKSRNASFVFTLLFLFSFIYIRLPHISSFVQNNTLSTSVRFISKTTHLLETALVAAAPPATASSFEDQQQLNAIFDAMKECNAIWGHAFPYTPRFAAPTTLVKAYCFAQTFRALRGNSIRVMSPLIARAILDTDSTELFQRFDKKKLANLALFSSKNELMLMTHTWKRELQIEWKTISRLMEDLMDDCFFYTEQIILETHILVDFFWDLVSFVLLVMHFYSYFIYTQNDVWTPPRQVPDPDSAHTPVPTQEGNVDAKPSPIHHQEHPLPSLPDRRPREGIARRNDPTNDSGPGFPKKRIYRQLSL